MNLKDILYITICIITVWLGLFLSILAHEAGHMIGYLLSAGKKKGNWYIAVGRGKQILKTKRLAIFAIPISGHFECEDDLSKKTSLLTLAGGAGCIFIHDSSSLCFTWPHFQCNSKCL